MKSILILTLASAPAWGAAIEGRVFDPSTAVVPGVRVLLLRGGQQQADSQTSPDGAYRFDPLAPRFMAFDKRNIAVTADTTAQVNALLNIGEISETVTVTGKGRAKPQPSIGLTNGGLWISFFTYRTNTALGALGPLHMRAAFYPFSETPVGFVVGQENAPSTPLEIDPRSWHISVPEELSLRRCGPSVACWQLGDYNTTAANPFGDLTIPYVSSLGGGVYNAFVQFSLPQPPSSNQFAPGTSGEPLGTVWGDPNGPPPIWVSTLGPNTLSPRRPRVPAKPLRRPTGRSRTKARSPR